jgi:phosphoribosylanthranilate isomerase
MQPKIKICGITSAGDAVLAERCGADYLGLVCEIDDSPRCIRRGVAAEITKLSHIPVILLIDKPAFEMVKIALAVRPFGLQIIGNLTHDEIAYVKKQTACKLWHPIRIPVQAQQNMSLSKLGEHMASLKNAGIDVIILDTLVAGFKGGTGKTCDWNLAAQIVAASPLPVFLAGGITPENAARGIAQVHPAGIDVSSGVEIKPGIKHAAKIQQLVNKVRSETYYTAGRCGAGSTRGAKE